jgi:hypothetical protein
MVGAARSAAPLSNGFQDRFRHLLNEQRNAISALDDVLYNTLWQWLVASDVVNHGGDFAVPKSVEGERGHVRPSNLRRLKFRAVRDD